MLRNCDSEIIDTSAYKNTITKLKNKIDNIVNINPPLFIIDTKINYKVIHVIQDGCLMVGTKQRVAEIFAKNEIEAQEKKTGIKVKTLIYTGSWNGFGPVATAFAAYRLGLKSNVYLSSVGAGQSEITPLKKMMKNKQINILLALNSNIFLCESYRKAKDMSFDCVYGLNNNNDQYVIPMGLNDDKHVMVNLLAKQIKIATKGTILGNTLEPRIWVVAGSGGILMAINKAIPHSKILVYLTGGGKYIVRVRKYIKKHKNIIILNKNIEKEFSKNKYYNTVYRYDDKVLAYIEEYGRDGDFIWNVASEKFE
jgi:hypothetical protein